MQSDRFRLPIVASVVLRLVGGGGDVALAQTPRALPIDAALRQAEITQRVPVALSPDGRRVAYTVSHPERIEPTGEQRYEYVPRTSAGPEALGCDVQVTELESGRTVVLGGGDARHTSWGPAWSPDGRTLAFFSDRDGFARVWLWDSASGSVRRASDAVVRTFFNFEAPVWTRDGKIVAKILPEGLSLDALREMAFGAPPAKSAPPSGASTVVVYRSGVPEPGAKPGVAPPSNARGGWVHVNLADLAAIDPATGASRRLVTGAHPRGYWLSPDGRELLYSDIGGWAENTQQPQYALGVVRLSDGQRRTIASGLNMAYGISVSWSPDGRSVAYVRSGQLTKDQIVVVSAADGAEIAVADGPSIVVDWQEYQPLWEPNGRAVYVMGEHAVARLVPATKTVSTVYAPEGGDTLNVVGRPGSGRYASPDGGRSMYVVVREGATKKTGVVCLDTTTGKARSLFSEDIFIGRGPFLSDVSSDGKRFVYAREDATHPEDLWLAGADFAGSRRVTAINPDLEGYAYGVTRLVEWKSGADTLRGALLLPAGYAEGRTYPTIVNVYGGSSRSNSLFRFGLSGAGVENQQLFATRGYAMLLPDAPIDLEKHSPASEIARTVLPGAERVVALGVADPDRLGVMGHSYGGYSTLALITQSTKFKAAMASASMGDLFSFYSAFQNGESGGIGYVEKGQGNMGETPWKAQDRYLANSPFFRLDRVETPLLLVHGGLDEPVNATKTFVALRRLGKLVELAIYEGEGHWEGTWGFANQADYWKRMLGWFGWYLKGETPPADAW